MLFLRHSLPDTAELRQLIMGHLLPQPPRLAARCIDTIIGVKGIPVHESGKRVSNPPPPPLRKFSVNFSASFESPLGSPHTWILQWTRVYPLVAVYQEQVNFLPVQSTVLLTSMHPSRKGAALSSYLHTSYSNHAYAYLSYHCCNRWIDQSIRILCPARELGSQR